MEYGGSPQYFPEYQLNLGAATTPLASNVSSYLWNGVYRRDFQNGFVLVNPGTTTYTLNLGGTYQEVQEQGGGALTDASTRRQRQLHRRHVSLPEHQQRHAGGWDRRHLPQPDHGRGADRFDRDGRERSGRS